MSSDQDGKKGPSPKGAASGKPEPGECKEIAATLAQAAEAVETCAFQLAGRAQATLVGRLIALAAEL